MAPRPSSQPGWLQRLGEVLERRLALQEAGEQGPLEACLDAADGPKRYLCWDEFRRRPPPDGWSSEDLWALVKLRRGQGAAHLPDLLDKRGRPFQFHASGPLLAALHRIDGQQRLWHDLMAVTSSHAPESTWQLLAALDEAHHSSAIEGAVTTRRQSKELIRSGREPKSHSERMVLNTWRTLQRLGEWVEQPLTTELICAVQAAITEGTLEDPEHSGTLRGSDDVHIVDGQTGDVVFVPPPAAELPERLQRLCRFANAPAESSTGSFVHPVARAVLIHHQLAYDHPFVDGNGRTARALFMWSILRAGYRWFSALSISRAVNRGRDRYYRSFRLVQQDGGDVVYFLRDQVRCIEQEIGVLSRHLEHQAALAQWTAERASLRSTVNPRQLALLDHMLAQPHAVVTAALHKAYHGVSQPTAWKDLSTLVAEKLLKESRKGRLVSYSATAKLRKLAAERLG